MAYIGQRPVIGRYIKLDQISSGFNGSNTGFSMTAGSQAVFPGTARNLLLSLGGVIQEPDTDFTIAGSVLTFTTPPVANTTFFGVIYGDMQATGTPSDGTVLPASIASSGHFKIPQLTVNEDGADVDFRVEGDTEANLLFVDASTDRVGIGTSTPASLLHVAGNLTIESTSPTIFLTDTDNNSDFRINNSNGLFEIRDVTNTTTRFAIKSDGKVGIGTTAQTTPLEVAYSDANASDFTTSASLHDGTNVDLIAGMLKNSGSGNSEVGLLFESGDTQFVQWSINAIKTGSFVGDLAFRTRTAGQTAAERMRIDSSGNLGIGTASPAAKLHVDGDVTISDASPSILFNDDAGSPQNPDYKIQVNTGNFVINDDTNSETRLLIDSSGRLGIGTTSPAAKLHAIDTAATVACLQRTSSTANVALRFQNDTSSMFCGLTSTATGFAIDDDNDLGSGPMFFVRRSDGNVGVGTATPDVDFHISGGSSVSKIESTSSGSSARLIIKSANNTYTGIHFGDDADDDVGRIRYYHNTDHMHFSTGASERMRIDSSGNVGIGTTSPDAKLKINGSSAYTVANSGQSVEGVDIQATAGGDGNFGGAISLGSSGSGRSAIAALQDGTDADRTGLVFITHDSDTASANSEEKMRIDSSGNVGIGTTSPGGSLDIGGNTDNNIQAVMTRASDTSFQVQFRNESTSNTPNSASGKLGLFYNAINIAGMQFHRGVGVGAGNLSFTVGGTEKIRIDSSGRLGVGTTSLASLLHLQGSGTDTEFFRAESDLGTNNNRSIRIVGPASDSASAPFRFVTGNSIAFEIDAVEKMLLDSTGQLGIGTSSPQGVLHVSSGTSGDCELIIEADTDNNNENDNPRIVFRQDGGSSQSSVGIGNNTLQLRNGVSSGGGILFMTTSTTGHDNAVERMRVHPAGNVSIGSSTNKARLYIKGSGNGTGGFPLDIENSDSTELFKIRNDGYIATGIDGGSPINHTGGSANVHINSNGRLMTVSSSKKYKEDITNASWGLAEVLKLRPVTFKYKTQSKEDKKYAGFTAEELHNLGLKDFVDYRNNQPDSINYPNMVALMAKAIQELSAKVAVLEAA